MKFLLMTCLTLALSVATLQAQNPRLYTKNAVRLGLIAGVNVGGEEATIKYANYTAHPYGMFSAEYFLVDRFALAGSLYAGTLSAEFSGRALFPEYGKQQISSYDSKYYGATVGVDWALPQFWQLTPVGKVRLGGLFHHTRVEGPNGFDFRMSKGAMIYGFGGALEYPATHDLTLSLAFDLILTNTDHLDGLSSGNKNDALAVFTVGANFLLHAGDEPPIRARAYTTTSTARPNRNRAKQQDEGVRHDSREGNRAEIQPDESNERGPLGRGSAPEPGRGGEGLALNPVEPPPEVATATPASNLPLAIYTQLNVSPLRRLRDLEDKPSLFTLKVWQTGDEDMQLKCYVEVLRDGRAIYQGNADLYLDGPKDAFTADEFLDLNELLQRNQGDALLPRGNYVVRVSTVEWTHELSSLAQGKFLNIDLRPIFGARADDARTAIVNTAVDVAAEGDEELVVNFFEAGQSAAEREKESGSTRPNRMREPLKLAPIGTVGPRRDALFAEHVQQSFTEALKLQSIAGSAEKAEKLKVVVSEVYFPIDGDQLTEESRMILDNVARQLNQHPEQFAEVRGYANDIGDDTYNQQLARRRANRVLEYLVRQKMNAYRISVADVNEEQLMTAPGDDPRLGRKVEVILRNRGM
ncbi:OmpA family protein [bacterium]|nr:OmpA family protein [bacterium]